MKFLYGSGWTGPESGDRFGGTNCTAGVAHFEMSHMPNLRLPFPLAKRQTPVDDVNNEITLNSEIIDNSAAEQAYCHCHDSMKTELQCIFCNPANINKDRIKLRWIKLAQLKMLS